MCALHCPAFTPYCLAHLVLTGCVSPFTEKDYPEIEKMVTKIAGEKQTFRRLVLSKAEALEMFAVSRRELR